MDINYFKAALSHHSKGNWNKALEIYQHILKEIQTIMYFKIMDPY